MRDIIPPNKNRPTESSEDLAPEEIERQLDDMVEKAVPVPENDGLRARWKSLSRNQRFGLISLALLIFAAAVIGVFNWTRPASQGSIAINKNAKKAVAPATVASPLSGLPVAPDLVKRPVTGILIENSQDARPQSGLQDAGVIFEAIAEGGITRFLTLYQDTQPQYIGPVRSLRPYYIDWAAGFDASIAHVGGSPDALAQIRNGGKDLDQFFNADSYWRQPTRIAPHNVYTSFEKMDALNKSKGYTSSKFDSWTRKTDQKAATPTVKTIDLAISSSAFNVHYDYDPATNGYLRSEGGQPQLATVSADNNASTQLHPKVVIAMVMSYGIDSDGQHSIYSTISNGTMYVFQDGGITQGTWNKPSRNAQFVFTDGNGQALKLNAGQTWISAIQAGELNYSP